MNNLLNLITERVCESKIAGRLPMCAPTDKTSRAETVGSSDQYFFDWPFVDVSQMMQS